MDGFFIGEMPVRITSKSILYDSLLSWLSCPVSCRCTLKEEYFVSSFSLVFQLKWSLSSLSSTLLLNQSGQD